MGPRFRRLVSQSRKDYIFDCDLPDMPTNGVGGVGGGRYGGQIKRQSLLTRAVNAVFSFVRLAEFEILFLFFFVIVFLKFKDITSRPDYNQIFVKRPGDDNSDGPWP